MTDDEAKSKLQHMQAVYDAACMLVKHIEARPPYAEPISLPIMDYLRLDMLRKAVREARGETSGPNYHDVVVYINDEAHKVSGNYSYKLTCTKVGGWSLWWEPIGGGDARLLGGEYEGGAFRIEVCGVVVCDNGEKPGEPVPTPPDGWDGTVMA